MSMTPEIVAPVAAYVPHPSGTPKNLLIQWLRLSAAVSVLLFHASAMAKLHLHDDRFMAMFDGRFGLFGVSLFFAISGYLMATAIKVQKPFLFLSHRVIRIYPLLWISYGLYYLIYHLLLPHITLPRLFFQDMMLIPHGDVQGVFGVEWSLVYEATFYVMVFAIGLAGFASRLVPIALVWLAAIAVGTAINYQAEPSLIVVQQILIHPASVGLAMGLLIPRLLALRIAPLWFFLVGCALVALAPANDNLDLGRWLYGIGTAAILTAAIGLSNRRPNFGDNFLGRGAAKAADCTYALYLCHMPVIVFLYQSGLPISSGAAWGAAVCASLVVALVLGSGEMKLYKRLKAGVNNTPPKIVTAAMIGFLAVFGGFALVAGYQQQIVLNRNGAATQLAQDLRRDAAGANGVEAIMAAAGYRKADDLTGAVDGVLWQEDSVSVSVWGWALDRSAARPLPLVIVFRGSTILGGAGVAGWRHDIERTYNIKRRLGFKFKVPAVCSGDGNVTTIVVGADKHYVALPMIGETAGCK